MKELEKHIEDVSRLKAEVISMEMEINLLKDKKAGIDKKISYRTQQINAAIASGKREFDEDTFLERRKCRAKGETI